MGYSPIKSLSEILGRKSEQNQGLFLADFIAVIWLYSQCQKLSFPQFSEENFKSETNSENNGCYITVKVGLELFSSTSCGNFNIQHCTVS